MRLHRNNNLNTPFFDYFYMKFLIKKISIITQLHEEGLFEIEDEKEDFEKYYFGDLSIMD